MARAAKGIGFLRLCAAMLTFGLLSSCGSGGGGGGGSGGNLQATFASIQDNVFTPICVACHAGATAPLGLRLDSVNSYALLVGVPSGEVPSLQRVEPFDPDNSYLIQKLEGRAAQGGRMPLGGTPLPQADIDVIRSWIANGALQDGALPSGGPIRVTGLSPLPEATEPMLPTSITAIFDRELDATSVNATTFVVERSGGDGIFGNGNDVAIVPVSVTVPATNTSTIVYDMSTTTSVEDDYRVTIVGTGPAVILDLDSNALDGEFTGNFPSGDGVQGGNFIAQFDVAGIQPTLQSIQDNVFTPRCSACHTGTTAALPGSMNLTSAAASHAALVGVASVTTPSVQRVAAGDPNLSFLIHKLEGVVPGGGAVAGNRMPLGGPFLDQATIDTIRLWITNGAAP